MPRQPNRPTKANITVVSSSEQQGKELLDIIGIMMLEYINRPPDEDDEYTKKWLS